MSTPFEVRNLDREGRELHVGDRVGFTMRGWFQPREQESFGLITAIDSRGGIYIDVNETYRHFTSSGKIGSQEKSVFFVHHTYDPTKRARFYSKQEGENRLSIFRVDSAETEAPAHAPGQSDEAP